MIIMENHRPPRWLRRTGLLLGLPLIFPPAALLAQAGPPTQPAGHVRNMTVSAQASEAVQARLAELSAQVQRSPDDHRLLARYGLALVKAGRSDEGLAALTRAAVAAPEEPDVLLLYAKGLLRAELFDEAVRQGLAAAVSPLASRKTMAEGYSVAGFARWRQGNVRRAEELLRKSVKYDKSNPRPFFNLGVLLYNSGKRAEGVGFLEQAYRIAPQDPKVLKGLADLYQRQGQLGKSLEFLERLAEQRAGDAVLAARMGVLYLETGQYEKAAHHMGRAAGLEPSNRDYHIAYATTLARAGRIDDARRQAEIAEEMGLDVSSVKKLIDAAEAEKR
ncbi:MAG: tetratricopeptide repeat protein [Acidobacteriota bacterium]|nr:tetratricopeptide repeat protein [Acidobacteriota bacterium]MDQ7088761.1 tetratricopeptide repeat protein [Acidobacteriota bacterium]